MSRATLAVRAGMSQGFTVTLPGLPTAVRRQPPPAGRAPGASTPTQTRDSDDDFAASKSKRDS